MESFFFHPKVVHLPMALAVIVPFAALTVLLTWRRGWLPARAWWLVVALQAALVGSGGVALNTGEADEERVERVVPGAAIEAHEEAAQGFMIAGGVTLALTVLAGVLSASRAGLAFAVAATAASVAVLGLGVRVGALGGALVYEHGAAAAFASPAAPSTGAGAEPDGHSDE